MNSPVAPDTLGLQLSKVELEAQPPVSPLSPSLYKDTLLSRAVVWDLLLPDQRTGGTPGPWHWHRWLSLPPGPLHSGFLGSKVRCQSPSLTAEQQGSRTPNTSLWRAPLEKMTSTSYCLTRVPRALWEARGEQRGEAAPPTHCLWYKLISSHLSFTDTFLLLLCLLKTSVLTDAMTGDEVRPTHSNSPAFSPATN